MLVDINSKLSRILSILYNPQPRVDRSQTNTLPSLSEKHMFIPFGAGYANHHVEIMDELKAKFKLTRVII